MADSMCHSESVHLDRVNCLCRLCASRSLRAVKDKNRKVLSCADFATDISSIFKINVLEDEDGKHSKSICYGCYKKLLCLKKDTSRVSLDNAKRTILEASKFWVDFDSKLSVTECPVCNHFLGQSKGGRPTKSKLSGPQKRKPEVEDDVLSDLSFDLSSSDAAATSTPKRSRPAVTSVNVVHKGSSPFKRKILRAPSQLKSPLTPLEEKYLTKLIRVKLEESVEKTTLRCKTGGQPLILKKITKPRKTSNEANTPLRKKRANMLNKVRMHMSGGNEEDILKQQGTELRVTKKAKRKIVLKEGRCGEVSVSAKQGAALRTKLGLSLTKYRLHKRFYRSLGVHFASERKERKAQLKAQCGEIQVEMRSLEFINEVDQTPELVPTPVVGVKDVPAFIKKLLDEYANEDLLTWHDGAIPDDEIWIKIGADHGGGSFKVMLQVANLNNANSKHNTFILLLAECKDSAENLRRLLGPYRDQIGQLQTMEWEGKRVRLFLFGDYEFMTKLYGLSGPQSIHPCLFCTASKIQIHAPPEANEGNVSQRTLISLKRDYQKYSRAGKNKKNAKMYNNVVRKPVIELELEQVAPPYLHILLGIIKKHHDLLENHCQTLDESIAKSMASTLGDDRDLDNLSQTFQNHVKQLKVIESKKSQIRTLQSRLNLPGDRHVREEKIKQVKKEVKSLKEKIDPLPLRSGPVTASLDQALQKNKIYPQAYHGRAFVGNHCNKYTKPAVYHDICQSVVQKVEELTDDRQIIIRAHSISNKFEQLNALFSTVHQSVSHQQPVAEEQLQQAQNSVTKYMRFFRANFPQTRVIPKQHLLEQHCVPFIRRWGVGLGLVGEQGGEGTHATINILKRKAWAQRDHQKRLKVLLTEHMTIVSPQFHGLMKFSSK